MQSDYRDSDSVMVLGSTSSWLYGGMVVDVPRLIYHRLVWMLPRVRIMFILDLSGSSFRNAHIFIDTFVRWRLWFLGTLCCRIKKRSTASLFRSQAYLCSPAGLVGTFYSILFIRRSIEGCCASPGRLGLAANAFVRGRGVLGCPPCLASMLEALVSLVVVGAQLGN